MSILELSFASGESSLSVRTFSVRESLSGLFTATLTARSPHDDIDLETIVGQPAMFRIVSGLAWAHVDTRLWSGVCSDMALVPSAPRARSPYALPTAPTVCLPTQRRNNRLFSHASVPEIVGKILDEWKIEHAFRVDASLHPKLELRVQYGESDHAFIS